MFTLLFFCIINEEMMRVALIGYGKMGHEIERVLIARGHSVALIVDRDNAADLDTGHLKGLDVAIEFSTPTTAFDNIMQCLRLDIPIVSGTTAWLDRYDEVVAFCAQRKGGFFYASNFSIGVNLFFKLSSQLAAMMDRFSQYDVTISEVHHTQKLDAPSGTAVTLADGVLESVGRLKSWEMGPSCAANVLEVTSQRRADVVGEHTVVWESSQDVITLDHRSKSREGLALGAVMAAEFLAGSGRPQAGVYTMDDLLGR